MRRGLKAGYWQIKMGNPLTGFYINSKKGGTG